MVTVGVPPGPQQGFPESFRPVNVREFPALRNRAFGHGTAAVRHSTAGVFFTGCSMRARGTEIENFRDDQDELPVRERNAVVLLRSGNVTECDVMGR